jgi:thiopeptide-type bacteriocin biosynthesis protein
MEVAHDLFCADSRAIVTMLPGAETTIGRREVTLMLCGTLMRGAKLEWYEQGDIWHRITQERPLPNTVSPAKISTMAGEVKALLLSDITAGGPLLDVNGPLYSIAGWFEAFRQAGQALGSAAREGALRRGLREIISYLVLFHWYRLGLHVRTQSILASAACAGILQIPAD